MCIYLGPTERKTVSIFSNLTVISNKIMGNDKDMKWYGNS